jgi:hypothetical protein
MPVLPAVLPVVGTAVAGPIGGTAGTLAARGLANSGPPGARRRKNEGVAPHTMNRAATRPRSYSGSAQRRISEGSQHDTGRPLPFARRSSINGPRTYRPLCVRHKRNRLTRDESDERGPTKITCIVSEDGKSSSRTLQARVTTQHLGSFENE